MGMNVLTGEGGGRKLEALRDVQNVDPVVDAIYRHFVSTRPLADDVAVDVGLKTTREICELSNQQESIQ